MFSSSIFDVAIGVIFGFLVVSLVSSAVLEAISSALKWRAKDLRQGVQQLVNDPDFDGLALKLYQHAAINSARHTEGPERSCLHPVRSSSRPR